MDEERFEELFTDVERWILQARRLKIAGDQFVPAYDSVVAQNLLNAAGFKLGSLQFLNSNMELQRAYGDACALLWGLALENAIKARQIRDGYITIKNGKAENLRHDHNLLEMIKKTHYEPTGEESVHLELLSYQVRVLARYSIGKNLKIQSAFTGRTTGGSSHEARLIDDLIKKILKDDDLVDIFVHGSKNVK